jgi:tripartite-type tricarboxylate transporter receptor subunit TctC
LRVSAVSRRFDRRAFLAIGLAADWAPVHAQPAAMKIIVGFAPGGASDAVARAFASALQVTLGRAVVVEPRAGADGVIAAQAVAAAAADGATLLLGSNTALVAVPALRAPPPYDPFTAFAPVSGLGQFRMSLLVNASLPVRTVAELLSLVERRPGELGAASSNSTAELALAQLLGWRRALHVPYKGDAPALIDLIAGRVHLMFATGSASEPHVADGRLRRLGSTAPGGGLELDVTPWMGLFGPAGLPVALRAEIAQGVQTGLHDKLLRQRLALQGFEPQALPPQAFDTYFRQQYARYVAAARRSGLRLER